MRTRGLHLHRSVPTESVVAAAGVAALGAVLVTVGLIWPQLQNGLVIGLAIFIAASYVAVGLLRVWARRPAQARSTAEVGPARGPSRRPAQPASFIAGTTGVRVKAAVGEREVA